MNKMGFLRFLTVCFLFVFIISFNFLNNCKENKIEKKEYDITIKEIDNLLLTTEKENLEIKEQEKLTKNTQSTEVSTSAVMGKIIKRYISPYNTTPSYSGVYLKNGTDVQINIKNFLNEKLKFSIEETKSPQVLIMHTHTTETYMQKEDNYYYENHQFRTTDNSKNMAYIGDIIEKNLNSAGIITLHDKTQHDHPKYTGSYSRSAKTVNEYLKKHPNIKIVLDIHRDSVYSGESDRVKLITDINGKTAAQVMLVMGSQTGGITGFPNWKENLKLAVRFQQVLEKEYPTLARPIMLNSKKYNQNLSIGSMLLEVGTDANTIEEAAYSAELVSNALIKLLKGI